MAKITIGAGAHVRPMSYRLAFTVVHEGTNPLEHSLVFKGSGECEGIAPLIRVKVTAGELDAALQAMNDHEPENDG